MQKNTQSHKMHQIKIMKQKVTLTIITEMLPKTVQLNNTLSCYFSFIMYPTGDLFTVLTLNVRGLNSSLKRKKMFLWLDNTKADIILLQETFCIPKTDHIFKSNWKGKMFNAGSNSSHSRGVGILFKENIDIKILNIHCCTNGRYILINFEFKCIVFSVVSLYAPNVGERIIFFNELNNIIEEHAISKDNLIIGGDFNCWLDIYQCKINTDINNKSRNTLKNVLHNYSCRYVSELLGKKILYTYFDKRTKQYSTLDYIFISNDFMFKPIDLAVCQPVRDNNVIDHNALVSTFRVENNNTRGPGYWKMNNQHFNDEKYCCSVR